ncbi:MOSC domain-containing protein [Aquimarina brevivitae]|uniref:MOSC domain-containing protein YiiM n=1 Tax=Aquimarina brevivitae TaxID=323412 RepID=A0A4Q7NUN2_9FLAO|nr:MOSC domain-containing protein [Aquimarina brevivitae]RZS90640.1 MOSC domain-containing protein YiiM [Aquimarina brevivitae]
MKIVSVNRGEAVPVQWRGKTIQTGIYKYPVASISVGETDVLHDAVVDRRYHGGVDKACYLYGEDHYAYWKEKYPVLDWKYGMFGENVTVQGFDESEIRIGDIYQMGTSLVQITRPRQPCFKLGIRFGTQKVLKEFIQSLRTGVYVRVLENGGVKAGDEFTLVKRNEEGVSIKELVQLLFHNKEGAFDAILAKAIADPLVTEADKAEIAK